MGKDKYSLLKERIVEKTGIETITITIEAFSLIVDDYSVPECLVHVGNYYGTMAVHEGDNSKVGITEQDLMDFNILQPIENKNIKNNENLSIDIALNINALYGAKDSSEFPKDVRISKTSDIEDLLNERRMAKININCNIPSHTTNDIPMFDPTILKQIASLARQTGNKFKLNNFFNELISKRNYTLDDIKKEDISNGKELSNVDWHKYNAENNKLHYLRYNLESIETPFKPKKEILKIFNKLIEQFKNVTKKDFKRLRTYVISGKDDYYHIDYGNELNMVIHYMKLNLPIGTTLIHLDNLIVDIRRIILEGKPTVKFNLSIEEFNLFKKWILDNSERIEDGN